MSCGRIAGGVERLFNRLQSLSEEHRDKLMPGYTHLQVAMPSSFGLWFGAYAESLTDDMQMVVAAYNIANQNPLGIGSLLRLLLPTRQGDDGRSFSGLPIRTTTPWRHR